MDADSLSFPLQIRTRASGDRFQALGMQGHSIKLSDFMINVRMPRRARSRWPLACSEGAIVWLPGYRLGDPCRVTKDTRNVIHLRLFRE
ncbi:MAG: tRNA lysidine(34) synthetase TilS [Anaerolineales bacterium]